MPDIEYPYQRGSETSRLAAERVKPTTAEMQRASMLEAIKAAPDGLTDIEMQRLCRIPGDSQRPRRNELAGRGVISRRNPFWPVLIARRQIAMRGDTPVWEKRDGCVVWYAVGDVAEPADA